jgi:hypothetical protein
MMVSQNLPDLIHEPKIGIWFELGFIFHVLFPYRPNMEKSSDIFHVLYPNIRIGGKFSMI